MTTIAQPRDGKLVAITFFRAPGEATSSAVTSTFSQSAAEQTMPESSGADPDETFIHSIRREVPFWHGTPASMGTSMSEKLADLLLTGISYAGLILNGLPSGTSQIWLVAGIIFTDMLRNNGFQQGLLQKYIGWKDDPASGP